MGSRPLGRSPLVCLGPVISADSAGCVGGPSYGLVMFERRAEFEVVFAPWKGLDPDAAVRLAVAWWQRQPGGHLVLFHSKNMLQNNNILAGLVRGARVESYTTLRRSSWRGGPVLAPWPSDKVLGVLDDDLAPPTAVAVIERGDRDDYVRAWLTSHSARNLHTGQIAGASARLISPVVEAAMRELSQQVNHNNGLVQAADKADAVRTLQALVRAGYRYDVDGLAAWAAANGFTTGEVERLRDYGQRVLDGRSFRFPHGLGYDLGPAALARWEQAVSAG